METKEKKIDDKSGNAEKSSKELESKSTDTKSKESTATADTHEKGSCCGGCG